MSQNFENKGKFSIRDKSMENNGFSRDLLQGFVTPNMIPSNLEETSQKSSEENEKEEEQIELTLGLSLNGRFGFDPTRAELYRSSSIPVNLEIYAAVPESPPVMVRTSSLPSEKGEAWRKRKEIQSLKRQEARGRRLGKRKIVKTGVIGEQIGVGIESEGEISEKIYTQWPNPSRQGSTGSSGVSESASPPTPVQGMVNDQNKKNRIVYTSKEEEIKMRNVFLEMPCVYTRGDGPNEKRIEGFLYKYNRGEEVKIVCVCHGSFLSPAEFVRHAGCMDVENPLKHIVVNPFPDM
ncbi:ninja-family protein AFP3-like [Impatiens glandulifera]|uniref:ninja-family protein AFP3-like n=1 Tax=Impatiens glandulifera TaxID=253017 RepID=UPI001FB15259|nr:ninja-family protein AFP3-like [Impatiens glandulifera]